MTWEQTIALIVTILVAVIAGIMYGNQRFDDMNRRFDDVHRRIDDLRSDMNARFAEIREELREIRSMLQEALRSRAS
ncbi:MAG: hypothetical protein QN121_09345 [Armatimonadota bacterium]|nr:hypothetical protein [Armatimonadota bacterium]